MFQNIDNTRKKSSTPTERSSKDLSAADPLSMIQSKTDTFDGLDPLSMFAAQEATATKQSVPNSASVSKKERVCIHHASKRGTMRFACRDITEFFLWIILLFQFFALK